MRYAPTIAFAAALCLLTACSDATPTAPSDLRADDSGFPMGTGNKTNETPAGESGILIGSGNVTKQASGFPLGSGNNTETSNSSSTSDATDHEEDDSGFPMGTGNRTPAPPSESGFPMGTGN